MPRPPKELHPLSRNRRTCLWLRFDQGWSQKKVAHETGVPIRTLRRWEKVYREEGRSACLRTGPKEPTKLTSRNLRRIEKFCKGKQRRSTRKCARSLRRKYGVKMHRTTVQRGLKDKLGLYPYRPKKPMLTAARKEKRLQVAREFQECISEGDPNPWSNHCFTDEKRFNSEPKPNSKNDVIWDEAPDDDAHYNPRSKYGGHSVEVWGGITRFGPVPLIFIERPVHLVDGRQQRTPFRSPDFIREVLVPSVPRIKRMFNRNGICDDEWTFQQDGDAKHNSNGCKIGLRSMSRASQQEATGQQARQTFLPLKTSGLLWMRSSRSLAVKQDSLHVQNSREPLPRCGRQKPQKRPSKN